MKIFVHCGLIAILTFTLAMAGEFIHDSYPFYVSHSGELIKMISSLIGTLFAIVLGLLISSSYSTFNNQQSDFNSMAVAVANMDLILKLYQDDTRHLRKQLLASIDRVLKTYWPERSQAGPKDISYDILQEDAEAMINIGSAFHRLEGVSQDDVNAMRQYTNQYLATHTNIIRNISNQVPSLLLAIVFGWACLLFFIYGILGSASGFEIFFLFLGSIAIASADFLILELTHPYQGLFKVSSATFDLLYQAILVEEGLDTPSAAPSA
ncbi:hypothetical protein THUN1379_08370 [Paludibacterium sp. THUN1379]|uniref:bestrophin-like domain n=1 Tax=Paludibacterium sp. THUN1379 TaxID=3112107 RepID=UPI00308CBAE3|nr:hypothetical protein THUN1379_08370 [Paludibacterium sp. THUN1379]